MFLKRSTKLGLARRPWCAGQMSGEEIRMILDFALQAKRAENKPRPSLKIVPLFEKC